MLISFNIRIAPVISIFTQHLSSFYLDIVVLHLIYICECVIMCVVPSKFNQIYPVASDFLAHMRWSAIFIMHIARDVTKID